MAAGVFYESSFHRCVVDPKTNLVRVVRSELRFPDVAAAETEYASLTRALEFVSVGRPRVLFDLRAAPLSGGEAIDAIAARFVPSQLAPFRKAAVLVQTAVGRLQILRMTKDHGAIVQVFDDERAALQHLGIVETKG